MIVCAGLATVITVLTAPSTERAAIRRCRQDSGDCQALLSSGIDAPSNS